MKRLLTLIALGALGYFGYQYYTKGQVVSLPPAISDRIVIRQKESGSSDFMNVLGAATQNLLTKSTDVLNDVTKGQAEPIINKAVSDLQDRVKELPEEQYKKVKYEFCKDVLVSPSPTAQ